MIVEVVVVVVVEMGSALMGSLQIPCVIDRGTFGVLPLPCLYLPKSARAYLYPQSVEIHDFAAAPLVLTPFVRNEDSSRDDLYSIIVIYIYIYIYRERERYVHV